MAKEFGLEHDSVRMILSTSARISLKSQTCVRFADEHRPKPLFLCAFGGFTAQITMPADHLFRIASRRLRLHVKVLRNIAAAATNRLSFS